MNVPNEQWLPANPDKTSGTLCRAPDILQTVAQQFNVEVSARYQPQKDGRGQIARTFCNIFVADCLQAFGISAPLHWWLASELTANQLGVWFERHDVEYGWAACGESEARAAASMGRPTIALWVNPAGEGHVALVLASQIGGPTMIAQAGASNFCNGPIQNGFGNKGPICFWSHL